MIKNKKIMLIFILIVTFIIINLLCNNKVFAIEQTISTDIESIDSNQYPQIKEMIQSLQAVHPNWKFKILYTDIEWSEAVVNEYTGHGISPRNLVPANNSNYAGDWICKVCGNTTYDNGSWNCASEVAIAYMMDARNSLNSSDIFQFMELTYTECDVNIIRNMVAGSFLNNESYINAIISAAQKYSVNAYYIVARILQEQGTSGTVLTSGAGYNGQYIGYYNIFNIGASGNGTETVILNGLKYAQSKSWASLEASIDGGVQSIAQSYIAKGQNTLYFQKFDVENSDGNLYWHQYMQNILAAQNEGTTLRKTFEGMNAIESDYTFIIPVFKNMPCVASARPSTTTTTTTTTSVDLVKVNVENRIRVRNAPNGDITLTWVYKDEVLTRLEKATEKVNGTYWDYVMKSDGTKGYVARETFDYESSYKLYLVPLEEEKPTESEVPLIPDDESNIIKSDILKVDNTNNQVVTIPDATVNDLSTLIEGDIVVKNSNGEIIDQGSKLATGYIINNIYVISVLGDVNGDGEIDTADLLAVQKQLLKISEIDVSEKLKAADINNDSKIDTADLLAIQKKLLNISDIQL